MTTTVFVNGVTLTDEDWFNDVNRLHYTIFADPADAPTARRTLLNGMDNVVNSLSGDVALNNTSNYFTGPTCAQGTVGKWLALGTVTVLDTAGAANFSIKLWDGTTVVDSGFIVIRTGSDPGQATVCGIFTTPAGNIRISVRDNTSTSGAIKADSSGNAKDSTLTVIRIG